MQRPLSTAVSERSSHPVQGVIPSACCGVGLLSAKFSDWVFIADVALRCSRERKRRARVVRLLCTLNEGPRLTHIKPGTSLYCVSCGSQPQGCLVSKSTLPVVPRPFVARADLATHFATTVLQRSLLVAQVVLWRTIQSRVYLLRGRRCVAARVAWLVKTCRPSLCCPLQ